MIRTFVITGALLAMAQLLPADDKFGWYDDSQNMSGSEMGSRPPTGEDGHHCREHGPCDSVDPTPTSPTPEPATVATVLGGLALCVIAGRKR